MKKIAIIGGGAAGMMAALNINNHNFEVDIYEKNDVLGKKISVSGNGKCNIANKNLSLNNFDSNDIGFVDNIFKQFGYKEIKNFFETKGLLIEEVNDFVYPKSFDAKSVLSLFKKNLELQNINLFLSSKINTIEKKDEGFLISFDANMKKKFYDKVLLSSGSKAAKHLGGSETGYKIAKQFGHNIIEPYPVLVQFESNNKSCKRLAGVKIKSIFNLLCDGKIIAKQKGDGLFTKYGISGLNAIDISFVASKKFLQNKKLALLINLLPEFDKNILESLLLKIKKNNPKYTIFELLNALLPMKISKEIIYELNINSNKQLNQINIKELKSIINIVLNWKFDIIKTHGFDYAEVCGGGIDLKEVDSSTLESKLVKNLFFAGEILDVVGKRGGFNLSFAWASGYVSGINLGKD